MASDSLYADVQPENLVRAGDIKENLASTQDQQDGLAAYTNAPSTDGKLHLSWSPILDDPHPMDVVLEKPDAHYRLYEDCLRYLQHELPFASLTCPSPTEFALRRVRGRVIPFFDSLVNALTDKYHSRTIFGLSSEGRAQLIAQLCTDSVLDFILSGVLAVSTHQGCHVTCTFKASAPGRTEADVYRALFLDVTHSLWTTESFWRDNVAHWSPMPWSHASLQELSTVDPLSELPAADIPVLDEAYLLDEDAPEVDLVRRVGGSPLDVPWFNARHDGYPFCSTLSTYTRIRCDGTLHSYRDDAALWVSALTYGLLEAITRSRIPGSMFLVTGGTSQEGAVLSGARILRFLARWIVDMNQRRRLHGDDDAFLAHGRQAASLIERAVHALDEEGWPNPSMFLRAGFPEDEAEDVICAITLVVVPLCFLASTLWGKTAPQINTLALSMMGFSRTCYRYTLRSCERRMLRAGWCPYAIGSSFLACMHSLTVVSSFAQLPPHIRSAPDEHKHCDEASCVFYTISDPDSYVPRHVHATCQCQYTRPLLEDVERMLSAGVVPIVVYDGQELRVQPASSCPYVAISHVWADGMGSTTDDGLPTCLVARIAGLVRQLLPDSGAFWMDSLCVPAGGALRKRAIKLMAETYRNAEKVLVIDACIRTQCSCSGRTEWEENLFRIATSGWVRRVWTLQEGLLARDLYFEFADGLVDVEEQLDLKVRPEDYVDGPDSDRARNAQRRLNFLSSRWAHVPLFTFRAGLSRGLFSGQPSISSSLPPGGTSGSSGPAPGAVQDRGNSSSTFLLGEVLRLLQRRTTTKPEDETIAISSLLPLDIDALLAITGPDAAQLRMREFLLQQREIPKAFAMGGDARLTLPRFSWAPRSLASSAFTDIGLDLGTAICTEDGLFAEYLVVSLEEPLIIPQELLAGPRRQMIGIPIKPQADAPTAHGVQTMFHLRLSTDQFPPDSPTLVVTALLLAEDSLPTDAGMSCLAVTSDVPSLGPSGIPPLPDGACDSDSDATVPNAFKYVASCALVPKTNRIELALMLPNGVAMTSLRKTWVLLV